MKRGKNFDFNDLKDQLEQMTNMGGMASIMEKMPGMGDVPDAVKAKMGDDKQFVHMIALVNSMTPQERKYPAMLKGSRKKRIAAGAGLQVQDLNRLVKQHQTMSRAMKKMSKGGMAKMMRAMQGKMPPGMGGMGGMGGPGGMR